MSDPNETLRHAVLAELARLGSDDPAFRHWHDLIGLLKAGGIVQVDAEVSPPGHHRINVTVQFYGAGRINGESAS